MILPRYVIIRVYNHQATKTSQAMMSQRDCDVFFFAIVIIFSIPHLLVPWPSMLLSSLM